MKFGSYLVCKEHIKEVADFLAQFFERVENEFTHDEWIALKVPGSDFLVNLMKGDDQNLTQNMTFEIDCDSFQELQGLAVKHSVDIESFRATKAMTEYTYHYIEILCPHNICKMEISYSEK